MDYIFRGFHPDENGTQIIVANGKEYRGEWVFGDLIHNIDCVKVRERETDINRIAKSYEVIPETVGEYTGRQDKNEKKIFEGDISESVSWNEAIGINGKPIEQLRRKLIVAYKNGQLCLIEKNLIGDTVWDWSNRDKDKMEVIGTIFDKEEV